MGTTMSDMQDQQTALALPLHVVATFALPEDARWMAGLVALPAILVGRIAIALASQLDLATSAKITSVNALLQRLLALDGTP